MYLRITETRMLEWYSHYKIRMQIALEVVFFYSIFPTTKTSTVYG
jgi:hypothetical protein